VQRTTKVVLTVLGVVLGLGILGAVTCVAAGAWWFSQNADRIGVEGTQARDEGRALGTGTSTDGCVDRALERGDACGRFDPFCQANTSMFLNACLGVAERSTGFCDGVPAPFDIMRSGNWAMLYCQRRGRAQNQACIGMVGEVQLYCHPPQGLPTAPPPAEPGPNPLLETEPAPPVPAAPPNDSGGI
jgi:hypothetical protein